MALQRVFGSVWNPEDQTYTFDINGTPGTERSFQGKLDELGESIIDRGGVADGSTDNASAFNTLFSTSGRKVIPKGASPYRVDSTITITASNIDIYFEPGAEIDFSNAASSDTLIQINGTEGSNISLSSNALADQNDVVLTSAATLSVGDYIYISSSAIYETLNNSTQGEFGRIKSIAGSTITLYSNLRYTYNTADTAIVQQIDFAKNINIVNPSVFGGGSGGSHAAMKIRAGFNIAIYNIYSYDFDDRNIQFDRSLSCKVFGGFSRDSTKAGFGYGVACINGAEDIVMLGYTGRNMRHVVTTGGTDGEVTNIKAFCCTADDALDAGFDSHPGSGDIDYSFNQVNTAVTISGGGDGIISQGRHFTAVGNIIKNAQRHGIIYQPTHNSGFGTCTINQNQIDSVSNTADDGINILTEETGADVNNVSISGNTISGPNLRAVYVYAKAANVTNISVSANVSTQSTTDGYRFRADSGFTVDKGTISANVIEGNAATEGIYLLGNGTGTMENLNITANTIEDFTRGIRMNNTDNCNFSNQVFETITTEYFIGTDTNSRFDFDPGYDVTISGGVIAVRQSQYLWVNVDTESAAASDDLDTVTATRPGHVIILTAENSARTVVVKDNTGNLRLGGGDFSLDSSDDSITLFCDGTDWIELSRSNNA